MKNLFLGILLITWLPVSGVGQNLSGQDVAERYARATGQKYVKPEPIVNQIEPHIEDTTHWFDVIVDFAVLPQPLVTARAEIRLVARYSDLEADWTILLGYSERAVEWLSDTRFVWPGPRMNGDVFTIPVQFICLESGTHHFRLDRDVRRSWPGRRAVSVQWCLDVEGELQALMGYPGPRSCPELPLRTAFFSPDSVVFLQPDNSKGRFSPLSTRMTITPTLQIGDTSTITYHLTAREFIPDGIDFQFLTNHMKVVSLPGLVDYSIGEGETIELAVDVVPSAVRNAQTITLRVEPDKRGERRGPKVAMIRCTAVFNDDGSLRFAYDGKPERAYEDYLPISYPAATESVNGFETTDRQIENTDKVIKENLIFPCCGRLLPTNE
jgi:hypothetical protein